MESHEPFAKAGLEPRPFRSQSLKVARITGVVPSAWGLFFFFFPVLQISKRISLGLHNTQLRFTEIPSHTPWVPFLSGTFGLLENFLDYFKSPVKLMAMWQPQ
jgi:hypothetical protein